MKKLFILIITLVCISLTGCGNSKNLIEISYDELAKKIENKDTFVLYVGSSSCSHCAEFRPLLEKIINKYKLDVYYINMANLSDSKYNAVLKKVDGKGTPITVYLEKGKTKISPKIEGFIDYDTTYNTTLEFFKDLNLIKGE